MRHEMSFISTFQHTAARRRLVRMMIHLIKIKGFNTQPPEGGWMDSTVKEVNLTFVSTHSRPKAAGIFFC